MKFWCVAALDTNSMWQVCFCCYPSHTFLLCLTHTDAKAMSRSSLGVPIWPHNGWSVVLCWLA